MVRACFGDSPFSLVSFVHLPFLGASLVASGGGLSVTKHILYINLASLSVCQSVTVTPNGYFTASLFVG